MFDRLRNAWRQEQDRDRRRIEDLRNVSRKRYMTDDEAYALNIAIQDWKQGRR